MCNVRGRLRVVSSYPKSHRHPWTDCGARRRVNHWAAYVKFSRGGILGPGGAQSNGASRVTDPSPDGSGGPKPQIEPCPAWGAVAHGDAGAVHPDDLHDDRQPQSGSVGSHSLPAPEPIKDARPVTDGYAR